MMKSPVFKDEFNNANAKINKRLGTAPYETKENLSNRLSDAVQKNPVSFIARVSNMNNSVRNTELKTQSSRMADRIRNREYQNKWYKGDTPTTAEYYSAFKRVNESATGDDRTEANEAWLSFVDMQNDPNSAYYEPYLYKMTNTAAAQGIYDLLGVDISGGITQKEIDELKQYADYSNKGVGGTPIESKNPTQQLAYWLYNLEKDEKTTQQAEKEMEWLNQDIQTLVDKGFSDEYIVKHLDMGAYPTLNKMRESAALGAVTPLNRPIGYSNDYVYGAIWAARNGGTSGSSVKDIANWHDKAGNMYVPDKKAEAARDPESDSYHPYSFGATIDLNPRKELTSSQKKTAENNTEKAKAELEDLKEYVSGELNTKTPDEIYDELTKDQMEMLEEDYPTLAKMEFARMEGSYINLTDTVDFAMPYFKEWINEEYRKRQAEFEALSNKAFENAKAYMNENFGTSFEVNGGGSKQEETPLSYAEKPDTQAQTDKEGETTAQTETPVETPIEDENAEVEIDPDFSMKKFLTDTEGTNGRTDLWGELYDYRQGLGTNDAAARSFIEKYPYLFGGETSYRVAGGGELKHTEIDTRRYTYDELNRKATKNELGATAANLLKQADAAQSAGFYSQYSYINLLMDLAVEVDNANAQGKTLEEMINTEGTSANALLNETTSELKLYEADYKATKKQERIDYGARASEMIAAFEDGTFDQMEFADEGEKEKWLDFIYEAQNQVITKVDGAYYDPKNYFSIYGDVNSLVREELTNYDAYANLEYNDMYWAKESYENIVSNRTKARLYKDYAIAKTAGITLDEYYNAIGYAKANDTEARGKGLGNLNDYVNLIVQEEAEAFSRVEQSIANDIWDAVSSLEVWEESEEDTNRYTFSEEEIQGALEYEMITPEQADMLRIYNDANREAAVGRNGGYSLEEWEKLGGEEAIKNAMLNYLSKVGTKEIQDKELGIRPEQQLGLVGNRTEGKASFGYVVSKGAELGAREYGKSWIETYYALVRMDTNEREKQYRGMYSREEVRQYIVDTINDISDPELKQSMLEEVELFEGDIYDFNFDFDAEKIQEKVRKSQQKIDRLQEEIAENCTQGQADAINTISGITNTSLNVLTDVAVSYTLSGLGVNPKLAQALASFGTSGIQTTGETINTLMDAGISGDAARAAGFTTGIISSAIETALDPLVSVEGKFSPAKMNKGAAKAFVEATEEKIKREASEGFLKAVSRKIIPSAETAGKYIARKALSGAQEAVEETLQETVSTAIPNAVLLLNDKAYAQKLWNWDEITEIMGDSFIQGVILDFGSDVATAPVKAVKRGFEINNQRKFSASRLAAQERVSTAQLKQAQAELEQAMNDGTIEQNVITQATQALVDKRTIEKAIIKQDELENSPTIKAREAAKEKYEKAQKAAEESANELDAAESLLNEASIPFTQEGTVPTQEEISYYEQATQKYFSAKEQHDKNLESFSEAVGEYETAKEAADEEVKAMLAEAETEARAEIVEEKKQERIQEAEEQVRLYEERAVREKERVLSEIQESTGASDREMERVKEKAQKIIDETAAGQIQTKEELKKRIETKFGGRYAVRFDTEADAEAGWVVRENGKGEIVFNAGVDADTLATSVAAHELVHVAEDSKYYDDLKELALKVQYGENPDAEAVRQAAEQIKTEYAEAGISLSDEQAGREHIAELIEDMFDGNLAWVNRLTREKPNVVTRVFEWVKEKIDYFKNRLKNGKEVANTMRNFERMRKAFEKALNDVASGKANIEADAEISAVQGVNQGEGTVREMALKRRVEARQKARIAARLMNASNVYRGAGDWTNYRKAVEARLRLGSADDIAVEAPGRTMRTLAGQLGINMRTGTSINAERFAAYDKSANAYVADPVTANDVAATTYVIGEWLRDVANFNDPSDDYTTAEFLNEYLTHSDKELPARTAAYVPMLLNALREAGKEFEIAFSAARDQLIRYKGANDIQRLNAFMTNRSKYASGTKFKTLGQKVRDCKIALIDATFAAEVVDQMTGTHELRKAAAFMPYANTLFERLVKGEEFINMNNEREGGDTLALVLDKISRNEEKEFNLYLLYKEALDRYNLGKNPFQDVEGQPTKEQMETFISYIENDDDKKHFKETAERLYKFWDRFMMTYMVEEGLLSLKEYQRMKKDHPHYVPLTREGSGSYKFRTADGNSAKAVYEPIENMMNMMRQFVSKAVQNRFARVFDELYSSNEGLGAIALKLPFEAETVPERTVVTDTSTEPETYRMLMDGETVQGITPEGGDVVTVYKKDGSRVRYKVYDKALYNLLSGFNPNAQKSYLNALGRLTRTMAYLTTGVNPLFIGKNAIRDFQKSINHGSWASNYFTGFVKWAKAFVEVWRGKSEDIKDYKALGGGEWELIKTSTRAGENNYKNELYGYKNNSFIARGLRKFGSGMGKISNTIETTSRFAEYKYGQHNKTTQQGKIDAFMAAQEATVDFRRRGNSVFARTLSNIVPFLNATAQGNYQMYRVFTDAEKERAGARFSKYLINNVLTGVVSVLAVNFLATKEDKEKYKYLLESYKRGYIILPWMFDKDAERDFVRLPVSQDALSKMFFEFGRQVASGEIADGGFGRDMVNLGWDVMTEGITGAQPIWAVFRDVLNNETWAGSQLVSDYKLGLAPYARSNDDTSIVFDKLSLALNAVRMAGEWALPFFEEEGAFATLTTPIALEYTAEQLTGWIGQILLPMASPNRYTGKYSVGGQLLNAWKAVRNAYSVDVDSYNTVDEIYEDAVDKISQLVASGKQNAYFDLNPSNTVEENKMAYEEARVSMLSGGAYKIAEEAISELWNEYESIQLNDNLTERQKSIMCEDVKERMRETKEEFVSWYLEFDGKYLSKTLVKTRVPVFTEVEKLDPVWQEAYERGEEYMLRAEETGKYPKPNASFEYTDKKGTKNKFVIAEYPEELQKVYKDAYEETWMKQYKKLDKERDYDSLSDEGKKDFMADVHSEAHKKAKEAFLDELGY